MYINEVLLLLKPTNALFWNRKNAHYNEREIFIRDAKCKGRLKVKSKNVKPPYSSS